MHSETQAARGRVAVAMSGGVDSSVAALLLRRQGYRVEGVTFRLRDDHLPGEGCGSRDIDDARRVCEALDIPHHVLDYTALFREKVVDYFVGEYRRGATPNPCVACNRAIKFGAFVEWALASGFDHVSTGHYALVEHDEARGQYRLRRGLFDGKDQSYVLYAMTQRQLAHLLLPLGGLDKYRVRALAEEGGLAISGKADSQDICFVPDGDYATFLEAYTGEVSPPGDFVDADGNVLGRHRGIWRYTIGQRKGLGISFGKPMFVSAIDSRANTVTLADNHALFTTELLAADPRFIDMERLESPLRCAAKIRYSARPAAAEIHPMPGGWVRVVFDEPQRAATPGQAVVFYDGDYVTGGATIEK